jgi:hypothetical protein
LSALDILALRSHRDINHTIIINSFINIIIQPTQCKALLTNKMPRQADIDRQHQATCNALNRLAESMGIPEAADPIPPVPPTHFDAPASVQEAFAAAFGRGRDIVRETPTIPA